MLKKTLNLIRPIVEGGIFVCWECYQKNYQSLLFVISAFDEGGDVLVLH